MVHAQNKNSVSFNERERDRQTDRQNFIGILLLKANFVIRYYLAELTALLVLFKVLEISQISGNGYSPKNKSKIWCCIYFLKVHREIINLQVLICFYGRFTSPSLLKSCCSDFEQCYARFSATLHLKSSVKCCNCFGLALSKIEFFYRSCSGNYH